MKISISLDTGKNITLTYDEAEELYEYLIKLFQHKSDFKLYPPIFKENENIVTHTHPYCGQAENKFLDSSNWNPSTNDR